MLTSLQRVNLGRQEDMAILDARNLRTLRALVVTVRKTIDTLIATCAIDKNLDLLYSDHDFDSFVAHLELRSALQPRNIRVK